ncbi:MAG: PIN-like domain-containing protein [Moraxellaceae bacterium]|nr:PIN-like domain-containing protein [Moraxellaceae bacterium]
MKKKFDWCLNPSKEELDSVWKNGILTVDTNVLLDLYRYHEDTRNSLIQSLEKFEGKKWLSHQAATEFFRNRAKVIVSSEKAFKQAQEETEKLSASLDSAIAQLKGNRIIPSALASELDVAVRPSISQALTKIADAKEKYPKFLQDDPILNKLLILFDGAVGEDFSDQEKREVENQAEERKKNKIPPGYLDDGKDEDRPYGDYYLWRQVLHHAKAEGRPIILVTSERKKDWWEEISGKTIGPRPELLKEARDASGQRILIYQTERFLEHALQRLKQPVNETVIEEIRAINTWRFEFDAAVKLQEQSVAEATIHRNVGILNVELRRPVRNFTVSGHLDPNMYNVPRLGVRLLRAPEELPVHRLGAGTGTTHDFNIHVVCGGPDARLPVGIYVFGYEAICPASSNDIEAVAPPEI